MFFLHVLECWVVLKFWLLIYKANFQSTWLLSENLTIVTISALAAHRKAQLFWAPCVHSLSRNLGTSAFGSLYQYVCIGVPGLLLKIRWTHTNNDVYYTSNILFSIAVYTYYTFVCSECASTSLHNWGTHRNSITESSIYWLWESTSATSMSILPAVHKWCQNMI